MFILLLKKNSLFENITKDISESISKDSVVFQTVSYNKLMSNLGFLTVSHNSLMHVKGEMDYMK